MFACLAAFKRSGWFVSSQTFSPEREFTHEAPYDAHYLTKYNDAATLLDAISRVFQQIVLSHPSVQKKSSPIEVKCAMQIALISELQLSRRSTALLARPFQSNDARLTQLWRVDRSHLPRPSKMVSLWSHCVTGVSLWQWHLFSCYIEKAGTRACTFLTSVHCTLSLANHTSTASFVFLNELEFKEVLLE